MVRWRFKEPTRRARKTVYLLSMMTMENYFPKILTRTGRESNNHSFKSDKQSEFMIKFNILCIIIHLNSESYYLSPMIISNYPREEITNSEPNSVFSPQM